MKSKFIVLAFLISASLYSQSLPIFLDGRFNDWNAPVPTYIDLENDGNMYDFKYFSVTNDEQFLYIRLKATPFFKLTEDNQLSIFIDGDNNNTTGYQINGIGAELRFNFGTRDGTRYYNGTTPVSHSDIQFRSSPTVTDTVYEIAIGRQYIPPSNGTGTIKLFLIDFASNGDWMPNSGETFNYTFDETPTQPLIPTEINRVDTSFLRIMDWNVLNDGLLDPSRIQSFTRLLQVINPDIMCFNECFSSSAVQVKSAISQMLPGTNWNAVNSKYVDLLAHPGLLSLEEAAKAVENRLFWRSAGPAPRSGQRPPADVSSSAAGPCRRGTRRSSAGPPASPARRVESARSPG